MIKNTHSNYSFSQGVQLLEKVVKKYGPIFTLDQILSISENGYLSASQISKLVSKLAKSGWIEIIKRGTYVATRMLNSGEVSPFGIAVALVHPIAISHWSAVAYHGFTTQNPVMIQATTTHKVITPEMRKGQAYRPRGRATWRAHKLEFEFIYTQPWHFWGFEKIWVGDWYQVDITDKERTALDLIVSPEIFGGLSAAAELLEGALSQVSINTLVNYAIRYEVGSVIKRLGWFMQRMEVDLEILKPLIDYPVIGPIPLDPSAPKGTKYYALWNIIDNMKR